MVPRALHSTTQRRGLRSSTVLTFAAIVALSLLLIVNRSSPARHADQVDAHPSSAHQHHSDDGIGAHVTEQQLSDTSRQLVTPQHQRHATDVTARPVDRDRSAAEDASQRSGSDRRAEQPEDRPTLADSSDEVTPAATGATTGKRKKSLPRWCLLPIGDSLTRGVGEYGSYREPLMVALRAQAKGVARVGSAGTLQGACTPKKPDVRWKGKNSGGDTADPMLVPYHEGHCNWDAGTLLRHWYGLLKERPESNVSRLPAAGSDAGCAALEYHTAVLLIGHNDVFRLAKKCRVREGCSVTWAPKGLDAPHAHPDHPEMMPQSLKCASAALELKFGATLVELGTSILRNLAGRAPSRIARFQGALPPPSLLIAVNPPTGFPCMDHFLRQTLAQSIRKLRDVAMNATESLGLDYVPRVAVVGFEGFERGKHTFDSTHPNVNGCDLMATRFADVLTSGWEGDERAALPELAALDDQDEQARG